MDTDRRNVAMPGASDVARMGLHLGLAALHLAPNGPPPGTDRLGDKMKSSHLAADYLLRLFHSAGDPITNLKLQKLVYYAQAWHLALFDTSLFPEDIQAWVHGPVEPTLYERFKQMRWNPITDEIAAPQVSKQAAVHLRNVFAAYGGFSPLQLEQMTHVEQPWINARGDIPPDASSTAVISHEAMKTYYRARLSEQQTKK